MSGSARNQVRWRRANCRSRVTSRSIASLGVARAVQHGERLAVADRGERAQRRVVALPQRAPPRRAAPPRTARGHASAIQRAVSRRFELRGRSTPTRGIAARLRRRRVALRPCALEGTHDPARVGEVGPRRDAGRGAAQLVRRARAAPPSPAALSSPRADRRIAPGLVQRHAARDGAQVQARAAHEHRDPPARRDRRAARRAAARGSRPP